MLSDVSMCVSERCQLALPGASTDAKVYDSVRHHARGVVSGDALVVGAVDARGTRWLARSLGVWLAATVAGEVRLNAVTLWAQNGIAYSNGDGTFVQRWSPGACTLARHCVSPASRCTRASTRAAL